AVLPPRRWFDLPTSWSSSIALPCKLPATPTLYDSMGRSPNSPEIETKELALIARQDSFQPGPQIVDDFVRLRFEFQRVVSAGILDDLLITGGKPVHEAPRGFIVDDAVVLRKHEQHGAVKMGCGPAEIAVQAGAFDQ